MFSHRYSSGKVALFEGEQFIMRGIETVHLRETTAIP